MQTGIRLPASARSSLAGGTPARAGGTPALPGNTIEWLRLLTRKKANCIAVYPGTFIGTVVHVHNASEGYEVEFITLDGQTVAVSTLLANQVRPIARREIAHVTTLAAA